MSNSSPAQIFEPERPAVASSVYTNVTTNKGPKRGAPGRNLYASHEAPRFTG